MKQSALRKVLLIFSLIILIGTFCLGIGNLTAEAVTEDIPNMSQGWYWPLQPSYKSISSPFGYRASMGDYHQGIDIWSNGINGQPVYAARKGTVANVESLDSAGNIVSIKHGKNSNGDWIYTTYMHLQRQTVSVGQDVDQNTLIGYVGGTGGDYTPHLHFQICKGGKNPAHNNNNDLNNNYYNPANITYTYIDHTVQTYTLTIKYYSNYADKSFSNPLNAVGSSKNVHVLTTYAKTNVSYPDGLSNYTTTSSSCYLGRTGYTGTGNWNTKPDGSGISVNQDTAFSSGQAFAQALGKDISSANATVTLYPEWTQNKLTVNYYSNYADKSFDNPKNAVGSDKNVIVKTSTYYYATEYSKGLWDYTYTSATAYLGRTGFKGNGNWNTKTDGSGNSVSQETSFSTGKALASALGKDISNGNATVNIYPEWERNHLTINYYSNYADHAFSGALNTVGADKNVLVKTTTCYYGYSYDTGLSDYTVTTGRAYLTRTYYTGTGYYNTKADGSGYSVKEDKAFDKGQDLAAALGKDITKGNATVNIYPQWKGNTLTINYYSNYADKSFDNPENAVGPDKNVIVCSGKATYGAYTTYGIRDYSRETYTYYLGRTGYSATGYWNTKTGGTGYGVHQSETFSSAQEVAEAFGKSLASGDASVNVYAQWKRNTLTINYYSNYADKSFADPLNAVSFDKNVLVRTTEAAHGAYTSYGVRDYSKESYGTYLGRTGYTATGYWNTKPDGSGYSVSETATFSTAEELAQAYGKDITNGDATVNLYPQWTHNKLTINYYSNYADVSFSNPLNEVTPTGSWWVRQDAVYYWDNCNDGLRNYTNQNDDTYLGRTGYTATGNWITAKDGSGYSVNQDTPFATGQALAQALGVDLTNGNVTIKLYPEWSNGVNAPATYINKTRAAVNETITFSWDSIQNANVSAYRVECYDSNESLVFSSDYSTNSSKAFSISEPGNYSITAKTVTTEGTISEQNNWQAFTVYNTFNVTLNPNYESSSVTTIPVASDEGTELAAIARNNYVFVNWNTSSDGNGDAYYSGDIFYPTENATLYAIWQKAECLHAETSTITENSVDPTCTVDGSYDLVTYCSNCGEELDRTTETVEMLGHSFVDYIYNNDATTEADGTETAKCDRCDETDTRTAIGTKLEHVHSYTIDVTAPTCEEEGYTTYTCECGDSYVDDYVPARGHNFSDYIYNNDATTEADGTETAKCDRCDVTDTRIAEGTKITHTHSYLCEVIAPTCKEEGYTTYTCSCGDTYTDDYVSSLGHCFTNYIYNNDATTEADGTETAKCDRCDATATRTKPGTKLTPETPVNPTASVKIKVAGAKTVDYRSIIIIKATATDLDPAYHLVLVINGTEYEGNNKEVSHECGEIKGDINYFVKIVDSNGNIQKDANGAELKKDGGTIKCNAGFFQKLIAFFQGLFGLLPKKTVQP